MHVAADPAVHGDALYTKGNVMNELEIVYYLSMHFPCICCIGCVRNKGPVSMNGDMFLKWVLMCEERPYSGKELF